MAGKLKKRLGMGCLGIVVIGGVVLAFTPQGHLVLNLFKNGAIQAAVMPAAKRTYTATNEANLKAIYTALKLYHDSEGQFPKGDGWMDAIQNRIRADDMSKEEAAKKLIRPDLMGQTGQYGYELNDAAAGKYKDDLPKDTILVFESKQTGRNAHGNPQKEREGAAITVNGQVLPASSGG